MVNVIQEYLVRLGFDTNDPSISKFNNILITAEAEVTRHVGGMSKKVLEAQFAIVGAFTGISSAIIGLIDKAAMADQGWRLMSERMMMTQQSAMKMDLITKALGADLNQIFWDPELHARFTEAAQDMDKWSKSLFGANYEKNMKGIRDIRFEFSLLGIQLKLLGLSFASNVFEKLTGGKIGDKLKEWVDWFGTKLPEISNKMATYAVPILKDTWSIMLGIGDAARAGLFAFTNLVGLFTGDKSIEGEKFSFNNLATAIEHAEHGLKALINTFTDAENTLAHTSAAMTLLLRGDFKGAGKELQTATQGTVNPETGQRQPGSGGSFLGDALVLGLAGVGIKTAVGVGKGIAKFTGLEWLVGHMGAWAAAGAATGGFTSAMKGLGAAAGAATGDDVGILGFTSAMKGLGAAAGAATGDAVGILGTGLSATGIGALAVLAAGAGYGTYRALKNRAAWSASDPNASFFKRMFSSPPDTNPNKGGSLSSGMLMGNQDEYKQMAMDAAIRWGIDPAKFRGLIQSESGFRNIVNPTSGASGLGQFTQETAKLYHLADRMDPNANLNAAAHYMSDLLRRTGGDWSSAIAAYKGVSAGGATMDDVRKALAMGSMNPTASAANMGRGGSIQQEIHVSVGGIYITNPGATEHQIETAATRAIRNALNGQTANDLAQLQPSYG